MQGPPFSVRLTGSDCERDAGSPNPKPLHRACDFVCLSIRLHAGNSTPKLVVNSSSVETVEIWVLVQREKWVSADSWPL